MIRVAQISSSQGFSSLEKAINIKLSELEQLFGYELIDIKYSVSIGGEDYLIESALIIYSYRG